MDQETEQTTEIQPSQSAGGPTRDELIAAVREAGGTESVDVAAEERAAAESAQAAPPAEAPPAEEEPRIASVLRAREKAHAEQEAARNHAQEMIRQAQEESARLIREAQERANKEWQAELDRRRQAFQASPTEHLRTLGDPQQIVDSVLRDGTPEGRAIQQLQRELAETKQTASQAADAKAEIERLREQVRQESTAREIERVKSVFMGNHATAEKAPYVHAEYGTPDRVFEIANQKAVEWQKQGLVIGKDFDFDDVAQYIEREAKQSFQAKLTRLGLTPAQQVSAGAPAKEPGNAPKVPANGMRTLSAAQGSERRTSPKPLHEMRPEEARKALIEEVAAARRANPDATS